MTQEYTIVRATLLNTLITDVNKLLVRGWQCQGGVCAKPGSEFFQALVREQPTPPKAVLDGPEYKSFNETA